MAETIVIVGGGPAGRAAFALLPDARVVARPAETAWHVQPGTVWIESALGIESVPFTKLLLCADEKLLLMALECRFSGGWPVVDERGETTHPGVFAAGRILGAANPQDAAAQARIAAAALTGQRPDGTIRPPAPEPDIRTEARLDPAELAALLAQTPGLERTRRVLAQAGLRGPALASVILPSRPVGLATLAARASGPAAPRTPQQDGGILG